MNEESLCTQQAGEVSEPSTGQERQNLPCPAAGTEDPKTQKEMRNPGKPENAEAPESLPDLQEELRRSRARVTQLERERELLSHGVPEEDLDYYAFKIGRLVTEEKDFRTAMKEFLKEHGPGRRTALPRSTGASLSGTGGRSPTTSETMNRLLRGR